MTHLLLWGNAYAQVVRDGKNSVLGLYPLLPENVEIDRTDKGEQRGLSFQSSVPASVYGSGGSCSDRENVSGSVVSMLPDFCCPSPALYSYNKM